MKCPACEIDVPSGRSVCTQCGALLPPAGERSGSPPPFAGDSSMNPRTEPLPVQGWDVGEEAPGSVRSEAPAADDAGTPDPGHATQRLDVPPPGPTPPEYRPVGWNPGAPGPGPMSPAHDAVGQGFGSPMPPAHDAVGQGFGSPMSPAHDAAAPNFGPPGMGPMPSPGYPGGWDPAVPPVAGGTAAPSPGGGMGRNRMLLLAGGIAVAVVLAGGLAFALTRGSADKAHTPQQKPAAKGAAQQAAAVGQVLKSGQVARGHLPSPLRTCDDVAAGVAGFQQVVRDRQQELSQAKGLKVDRLPDGSRLRQSMIGAYRSSLAADRAYLAWAREVRARGCGGKTAPLTAAYKNAIAANDKAGPAKRQVAALWKPIAGSHALPAYAWNRL